MIWLWLSALAMVITAVIHSVAGEKRIIGPLLAGGAEETLGPELTRTMRGAWHLTSLFMVLCGVVTALPGTSEGTLIAIGSLWLALGIAILVRSRGRHPGWPTLAASGVFALIGVFK